MNTFTDIHIRWNNGQDLLLRISLYDDNIGDIKQLVMLLLQIRKDRCLIIKALLRFERMLLNKPPKKRFA